MEVVGFLSNIGVSIKALGIEKNAFGTLIVTSIGGAFKIEDAYAPLFPSGHTIGVATICSTTRTKLLNKSGEEIEDELMTLNFALDHRYMDGMLIAKLIKEINYYVENPEMISS